MAKRNTMLIHLATRHFRTTLLVTAALGAGLLLLLPSRRGTSQQTSARIASAAAAPAAAVQLAPTYEVISGTEVVWQSRPTEADSTRPRGVLLAFHGCSHAATDWFPSSPACPKCIGLPEEVRITSTALARRYALLAISSSDRAGSCCWDLPMQPDQHSTDTQSVAAVLATLLPREGLERLPLFALGASSGGAFVLVLPAFIPLAGVCSQIMALPPNLYRNFLEAPAAAVLGASAANAAAVDSSSSSGSKRAGRHKAGQQPPVLFVPMERDQQTAMGVEMNIATRRELGLVSRVLMVRSQPVTAAFLAARVPELAEAGVAQQVVQLLVRQKLLQGSSHQLLADPRSVDWQQAVRSSGIPGASSWMLTPDASPLSEVLNVAWAQHEIVSDTTGEMLKWFEEQL